MKKYLILLCLLICMSGVGYFFLKQQMDTEHHDGFVNKIPTVAAASALSNSHLEN